MGSLSVIRRRRKVFGLANVASPRYKIVPASAVTSIHGGMEVVEKCELLEVYISQ
jgi:hypothetical protein